MITNFDGRNIDITQVTDIVGECETIEFSEQDDASRRLRVVVVRNDKDPSVLYLDTLGDVDVNLVEWAIGVARDRLLAKGGG